MQDPAAIFSQLNGGNPQFPEPEHLKCPRCDSPNTKFCYYNNYNLSQPRHFCKNCRRYWTKGGVLRNIPVGGGSRKNSSKRTTNKSSSSITTTTPPLVTAAAASSSSSSPPRPHTDAHHHQPPTKSEPYSLMLINAPPLDQDRRIIDLSGGGRRSFSSLLELNDEGHFGHLTKDGLICDGSNLINHGPNQSSVQAQDSPNGGPLDEGVYRPSWSGNNASWPDHLAMYTPEASTNYQQFIEFPPRNTRDS